MPDERLRVLDAAALRQGDGLAPGHPLEPQPLVRLGARVALDRLEAGREEQVHALVGEARRAPEARRVGARSRRDGRSPRPARAAPRAPGPRPRRPRPRSSVPAGSSRSACADRGPELADEEQLVAGERHDDDRAGMLDDLARVPSALGVGDRVDAERQVAAAMDDATLQRRLLAGPGPARTQHRTRAVRCGRCRCGPCRSGTPRVVRATHSPS